MGEIPARPLRGRAALTFPNDDLVLAEHVREIVDAESASSADTTRAALEARLRPIYPNVVVRLRDDLAGFGDAALYVFRDGGAVSAIADVDGWINEVSTARLVTNAEGVYVEANEVAAALFGRSREDILGRRAGDFTRPDARITDADELWKGLKETGKLHSLAVIGRPDGTERIVEFVTLKDGAGPGLNVTLLRPVGGR